MNKNSKRIIFTALTITLIMVFCLLGSWQLKRKIYKDQLIANISEQINLPTTNYTSKMENNTYRNLKFSGEFDSNLKFFIYGSNGENETNGYFLVMPFMLDDGKTILVVRGWTKTIDNVLNIEKANSFSGLVIKPDKISSFTPSPDLDSKVFYSFNVKEIQKSLKINCEDFLVLEDLPNDQSSNLNKVNIDRFISVYNRHFEYIITWFTLALLTSIIFIVNRGKL